MEARPRETLPKNLCPADTSSSGPKVLGVACRCGGGYCGGGACCAETGTAQHISAANITAARRDAKLIKNPCYRNSGRRLNLTPTNTALGCDQRPLDSDVIDTNYDGTTAGKIRLVPPDGVFRAIGGFFRDYLPGFSRPGRDHRAGDRQPVFRACHRGF